MADGRPKPLVAGNWKMNGLRGSLETLADVIAGVDQELQPKVDLLVCPPATLIVTFADRARGSAVAIGGQDCHVAPSGAFTGDVSAEMLADAGAVAVIVGHSERRAHHGETDETVAAKVGAARRAGLTPIICVGETRAERDAGKTLEVASGQLLGSIPDGEGAFVVAYEPVWAIGTGLTPTRGDVAEVHGFIRDRLGARFGRTGRSARLLYGGSVKPENARDLLAIANVDGALVGGASLVAGDLLAIAEAYR